MAAQKLKPDAALAASFLETLAPDGKLTFQTFDDEGKKRRNLNRILHGSFAKNCKHLTSLNNGGAGVFVMVNRGDMKGRAGANVQSVRALFLDLDGAPLEPALEAPERPHIVTETSPGKYHAFWLVDGVTLGQFKTIEQKLIAAYGGDKKVCDLPRVMRLPGFFHRKGKPFMVRTLHCEPRPRYNAEALLERLNIGAPTAPPETTHGTGTPPHKQFVMLENRQMEHANFKVLSAIARMFLFELIHQYNGFNNGDLCLAPKTLKARGIELNERTIWSGRDELVEYGWIQYSRWQPRMCYLFALTFKPVNACRGKHNLPDTTKAADTWKLPPDKSRCTQYTRVVQSVHQRRRKSAKRRAA